MKTNMLVEEYFIEANQTILVIGKVLELYIPDDGLDEVGNLDLAHAKTIAISGLDTYHATEMVTRLPYARVK